MSNRITLAVHVRGALLLATLPMLATGTARAANAPTAVLDEIVVSAQKRTENVQDVPISITAFAAEYLERLSTERVADVLDFAPNVARSSGPTGGADGFFFIRGVGQVDNSATVDPGVGVYIDEVYLGRIQGASLDLLDVDRVEVLRGPQGTLFGRNTIGGAVSVITKDPDSDFNGSVKLTLGSRDKRDAVGSANLPLSETAGLRLSAFSRDQDGWVRNAFTGADFGRVKDRGARLKFKWEFAESASLTLTGDLTRRRGSPLNTTLLAFNPLAGPIPGFSPTGVPFPFPPQPPGPPAPGFPVTDLVRDTSTDPYLGYNSIPARLEEDTDGIAATLAFDFGAVRLKSITAYRTLDQKANADLDGTGYALYDTRFDVKQDQASQEFQLSGKLYGDRIDWLLGAYYFREQADNNTFICVGTNQPARLPNGAPIPLPPGPFPSPYPAYVPGPATRLDGRCLQFVNNIALDNESYAAYGNLEFRFTDRWSASAGVRWTRDRKQQYLETLFDNTAGVATLFGLAPLGGIAPIVSAANPANVAPLSYDKTWSEVTPRVGVNFRATDDLLVYATYAQGFKSGGFGARATPLAPIKPYDPEKVNTAELGLKSEFADRRVRVNAAAFLTKYKDIQLLILDPVSAQFETRNGGDNEVKGVELEVRARPVDGFDLTVAAGWLDNEYTSFAGVAQLDRTDKLPNAPEYTFDVGAEYRWALANGASLGLRGDWNYRAEHWFQALNNPLDRQGGYGLVSARATLEFPSQGLTIGLYGLNLADKVYFVTKNDTRADLGVATGNYGPGREWGIDLAVRF
jgi:iron complex outermembrane receptor protein